MLLVAARTGIGFIVVLAILGVIHPQTIGNTLLLFAAIGLIPGTNIAIPPDLTLIMVAASLMLITMLLVRLHSNEQAVLNSMISEYAPRYEEDDPGYGALVPGLNRLISASRSLASSANDMSLQFYFWLKYFGRPVTAQVVTARKGFTTTLVRFDHWTLAKYREPLTNLLHDLVEKAKVYIARMTIL